MRQRGVIKKNMIKNRDTREKSVEDYLRLRVKQMGGRAYKFTSPGNAGVPDRLIILPGGRIAFLELKAPGRKPTVRQKKKLQELSDLGCRTGWADSKSQVDAFLGVL